MWGGSSLPYDEHGNLEAAIQDQYSDIVDYYLCIHISNLALAQAAILDNYTLNIVSGVGVANGTYVCIQENSRAFQARILSGGGTNTLTLDTPLDYPFTVNASIANRTPNLNVDGSSVVKIASLGHIPGVKWDITRMILSMVHSGVPDDGKFGGIAALTKGIVIRKSNGIHHTIFNAKTNGDLRERAYDVTFSDSAPAGQYGTSMRRSFNGFDKNGVTIRLDGDLNERIEILIQDPLGALTSFKAVGQGHVVVQ